jgi:hypothetical protein
MCMYISWHDCVQNDGTVQRRKLCISNRCSVAVHYSDGHDARNKVVNEGIML